MSTANLPRSLDIILVRGSSTQSTWLCWLQSIAMLQSVSFSHVVLSMGEGVCLHATAKGVGFIRPSDLWSLVHYRAQKVVLRSKKIEGQIERNDLIRQTVHFARKTFGARYNYFFDVPKQWHDVNSWFCSELASAALESVGHSVVPNRKPERVWPGHFQRCRVQSDEWEDVTDCYNTYVADVTKGADPTCTDAFARARYRSGEADFYIFCKACTEIAKSDDLIRRFLDAEAKLRETVAAINKKKKLER